MLSRLWPVELPLDAIRIHRFFCNSSDLSFTDVQKSTPGPIWLFTPHRTSSIYIPRRTRKPQYSVILYWLSPKPNLRNNDNICCAALQISSSSFWIAILTHFASFHFELTRTTESVLYANGLIKGFMNLLWTVLLGAVNVLLVLCWRFPAISIFLSSPLKPFAEVTW